MKTFDEEFPSLKGRLVIYEKDIGWDAVLLKDIQNSCLDKQKVREVILKMPIKASIEPLLKELGL